MEKGIQMTTNNTTPTAPEDIASKLARVREMLAGIVEGWQHADNLDRYIHSDIFPVLDEIEAALPVWRSMESAPKDGTRIIGLWRLFDNDWKGRMVWWDKELQDWLDYGDDYDDPEYWTLPPQPPEGGV